MRCDIKGNIYVTRHGKGTVVVLSPEGKIINEIQLKGKNLQILHLEDMMAEQYM